MRVLTIGTFDVPHMGHAAFLKQAENFGHLTVGVNSDEFVEQYKGAKPVYEYYERAELVRSLGYAVVKNTGPGRELITQMRPKLLAIGSDWATKDYYKQIDVHQAWLDAMGITVAYIPYTPGISSTSIKERLSKP